MMSKRLARRSFAAAKTNAQSGLDAAVTIAARTAMLAVPDGKPSAKAREARRMTQEKIDAAVAGAFAAQAAWAALLLKAAFGGIRGALDLSIEAASVMEASAKPARRAVRANARRLAGTRTRS
jgi:hypothetical protein